MMRGVTKDAVVGMGIDRCSHYHNCAAQDKSVENAFGEKQAGSHGRRLLITGNWLMRYLQVNSE